MKTLFDPDLTLEDAELLVKNGADIHKTDDLGQNLLCYTTDITLFKFFIENGININHIDVHGRTILHQTNSVELIKILVNAGANVNIQDNNGFIPLIYFHKLKDDRITEVLVGAGSNLNLLCDGQSLLSHMYSYQFFESKKTGNNLFWHLKAAMLISHGALASERDVYEKYRHFYPLEQQKAFDAFSSITNNDKDFFQMCLAYQENIKNNVKIEINDLDIL